MLEDRPMLQAANIRQTFGDGELKTEVLRGVSLELHRGQLALLMGPSGSGKSTLLAVLSGLLQPTNGSVMSDDNGRLLDIWKLSPRQREDFRRRQVGFIFQGYNLFPALTARQQLEIVLRWGGVCSGPEARRRADEMLGLLGLGKKGDKKPAQLSGGEKQRVAIGRALIKNPRYVFADEPSSALDWENGERVIEMLRAAAHERDATILIVSHDHRIEPYCDAQFTMEDGTMRALVRPDAEPAFWRTIQ